jgi:hypothetical protein
MQISYWWLHQSNWRCHQKKRRCWRRINHLNRKKSLIRRKHQKLRSLIINLDKQRRRIERSQNLRQSWLRKKTIRRTKSCWSYWFNHHQAKDHHPRNPSWRSHDRISQDRSQQPHLIPRLSRLNLLKGQIRQRYCQDGIIEIIPRSLIGRWQDQRIRRRR